MLFASSSVIAGCECQLSLQFRMERAIGSRCLISKLEYVDLFLSTLTGSNIQHCYRSKYKSLSLAKSIVSEHQKLKTRNPCSPTVCRQNYRLKLHTSKALHPAQPRCRSKVQLGMKHRRGYPAQYDHLHLPTNSPKLRSLQMHNLWRSNQVLLSRWVFLRYQSHRLRRHLPRALFCP